MPLVLFLSLLSLTLFAGVAVAALFTLKSCALDWTVPDDFSDCQPAAEIAAEARLAALNTGRIDLLREVYALERELPAIQCVATNPDPTRPLLQRS